MLLKKRHHDLILFIEACLLVKDKKHITIEGQKEIAKIASKLSSKLNLENKKILAEPKTKLNAEQITGFIDAEGCFSFKLKFDHKMSTYTSSSFAFYISQESSEFKILKDLISFFDCGIANIKKTRPQDAFYVVTNKKDLAEKIIPFFDKNELQTIKQYSFLKFKKVFNIFKDNKIISPEHSEELNNILSDQTGKRPKK